MKKVHNFTAGPCILPQQAIDNAIEALKDFKGTGVPVISISHRTKEWESVMDECRTLWRELLNIPEDYEILFLGGGASMGFRNVEELSPEGAALVHYCVPLLCPV